MRRYKLVSNMIRWRKHTGECFGIGELIEVVVTKAMFPAARTGWEVGGQDIMRKVRPSSMCFLAVFNNYLALIGLQDSASRSTDRRCFISRGRTCVTWYD